MNVQPNSNTRAFTLVEFLFAVVALTILVALLLPRPANSHTRPAPRINCVNNLKQVGLSFRQWALDNGDKFPMQVSATNGGTMELVSSGSVYVHFLVMSNELNTPKVVFCPAESNPKRHRATIFAPPFPAGRTNQVPFTNDNNVSYFVGVDAVGSSPQMFLAGDDNLTVGGVRRTRGLVPIWTNTPIAWTKEQHVNQGNIALADGSVQSFDKKRLNAALANTGAVTNRLAFP